jgi:Xaa-Pro aminopeptidase
MQAIDLQIWKERRQNVLKKLKAPFLFRGAVPILRNGDVHYSFRQNSDFFYLTGFCEPNSILLAIPQKEGSHKTILFVPEKDPKLEVWNGKREGVKGAIRNFGADEAFPAQDFWKVFPSISKDFDELGFALGKDRDFDEKLFQLFGKRLTGRPRDNRGLPTFIDPRPIINECRLIKSPAEIEHMQKACDISAAGHKVAMALTKPSMWEYEVQAEIEAVFRRSGAPRVGYDSIVASGNNANILHYIRNRRRMRKPDLLLIDAGAEWEGYSGDVTRTFPVSGIFSDAQKAVYRIVLRCQKKCIRAVRPGCTFEKLNKIAQLELTKGLIELGILKGDSKKLREKGAFKPWFMHGIGHWLGMDVHDVGPYQTREGKPLPFKPGMVLTIEPGLYLPANDKRVPKEFRGIGIRIEDDVLVTRAGNRVLTKDIPKEILDIEELCHPNPGNNLHK